MQKTTIKILLTTLLCLLSTTRSEAFTTEYWMYLHIQVDCYPTGSGKVYASTTQSSAKVENNCTISPYIASTSTADTYVENGKTIWYVNTVPTNNEKWEFAGWVKDADENTDFYDSKNYVSTERNPSEGFKDPGQYAVSNKDGTGDKVDHNNGTYYEPNPFPITLRMTAVYRNIEPDVVVNSNNTAIGSVDINPASNKVGDQVSIYATPSNYNSKFEGWYKDGVLVSKDNPYTFTITDANKGKYIGKFVEHKFLRIKNSTTNRYINAIDDVGSETDYSSLELEDDFTATRYEAGSVFYIWDYTRTGPSAHPYVFDVQGFSSKSYYDDTKGIYVIMLYDNESEAWTISDKDKSYYMADKKGKSVDLALSTAGFPYHWKFEHIDNDLKTCENYFSLDPEKLVQVGDYYYTTLRTSWNILFNPEQMTPYVVTSFDEEEGTFEMEPLTGNIIPAGTPVVIKTRSKDIVENRMVPTVTAAESGAVPEGNQLRTSEKYFPNQSVSGTYKALTVVDGQLAFGGSNLGTVNGNEAYLPVSKTVTELPASTLREVLDEKNTEARYNITDLTCVLTRGNVLYCKDDNNYAAPSVKAGEQIDYLKEVAVLQKEDWDQSNWVAVILPGEPTTQLYEGKRLKNVIGKLTNTENPEFTAIKMPETGDENKYDYNNFITCNFVGTQTVTVGTRERDYFFVTPKPMEIARVNWAMWDEEQDAFLIPTNTGGELQGGFYANFSMLDAQPVLTGKPYNFDALIKRESASGSTKKQIRLKSAEGVSTDFVVYPLEMPSDPPTAITTVSGGEPVRVTYYNPLGIPSATPHSGVNIIVTDYSDGTRTTTKVFRP